MKEKQYLLESQICKYYTSVQVNEFAGAMF